MCAPEHAEQDSWLMEAKGIKQIYMPASQPPPDLETGFTRVLSCALN